MKQEWEQNPSQPCGFWGLRHRFMPLGCLCWLHCPLLLCYAPRAMG